MVVTTSVRVTSTPTIAIMVVSMSLVGDVSMVALRTVVGETDCTVEIINEANINVMSCLTSGDVDVCSPVSCWDQVRQSINCFNRDSVACVRSEVL